VGFGLLAPALVFSLLPRLLERAAPLALHFLDYAIQVVLRGCWRLLSGGSRGIQQTLGEPSYVATHQFEKARPFRAARQEATYPVTGRFGTHPK
jgi:hypothetical protein